MARIIAYMIWSVTELPSQPVKHLLREMAYHELQRGL